MRVWRIVARRHADEPYSGEGARRFGGRWNPPGVAVAYGSATLSLAALELFVHLRPRRLPEVLVAVPAEVPDSLVISRLEVDDLPADWRQDPAPESLREIGTRWVEGVRRLSSACRRSSSRWNTTI